MVIAHNLGFPRIGLKRELKWVLESYWQGEVDQVALATEGKKIRTAHWNLQLDAGHDFLSVGDFSWYDHVLDLSTLLGVIPLRFGHVDQPYDIDTYFRMARGRAPTGKDMHACEMTKWFDTNYHYIVPEFAENQAFSIYDQKIFLEIAEAQLLHKNVKPILLGPLTYLWLGKAKGDFDKLNLLPQLLKTYFDILGRMRDAGVEWIQIDEPILVLDLPLAWQQAFKQTYDFLQIKNLNLLLTTYFGALNNNLSLALDLPTAGLHVDAIRGKEQLVDVLQQISTEKILSIGAVDGRNIWRTDLRYALQSLKPFQQKLKDQLWIGSSCSLLHCPVDLDVETDIDAEIKTWLAFAKQKLHEISTLKRALNEGEETVSETLQESDDSVSKRQTSHRIHNRTVKERVAKITESMTRRISAYERRKSIQQKIFALPSLCTTTIGSFPQTTEIRRLRQDLKSEKISSENYKQLIRAQIRDVIEKQVALGIDVLVHGEAERNDMVEYFGEQLEGFIFTKNGWVQSYGSRCVKPPIIFGDVSRAQPMTVEWAEYAQSLSEQPVKGMLTGPTTILCWSFVRDDQPRFETAKQIALALRDEVADLIKAGIHIIQIDEPAFREGLPLRQIDWQQYLNEAVYCFRVASCGVPDNVQIHTHMCYSEFNETIHAIAELDADVITIETSRSDMELLKAFENFQYPNDIGPGVYDIHSPRIPTVDEIVALMEKALCYIPIKQLWINPDCGLKTRSWQETELALKNMVSAAKILREKYQVA